MFQALLQAEEEGIEVTTMPMVYEETCRARAHPFAALGLDPALVCRPGARQRPV